MAIYKNTPPVVTNGLILYLDANNRQSYPGTGSTWYDLSGQQAHGTLLNNPAYVSSSYFYFDGISNGVDGVNVPQNYVDLMIGMYSEGSSGTGVEMVFAKYNDLDKSFRTTDGTFRYTTVTDFNDWQYQNLQYSFVNGVLITADRSLKNSWNIIRSVNLNSTFTPPFVYSISSDFLSRRYKGRISFVLCYNRVLSFQEVTQNYNALKARFGLT